MTKATLILSALYLAAIGLALMVVPLRFGVGAVPADASPELSPCCGCSGGRSSGSRC